MRRVRAAATTRTSAVLVGAILLAMVVFAAPASACTPLAEPTGTVAERDAAKARAADAVVVGTVVAYYAPPHETDGLTAPVVYTVEVDAVLKGTATRLEPVLTYSSLVTTCGGVGGGGLALHARMVVFLQTLSPPTYGARYTTGWLSGNRLVDSAVDVRFPGAVAASPLPGGSIVSASSTPGDGRSRLQTPALGAALIALGVAVGAVAFSPLLRKGRDRWRTPRG